MPVSCKGATAILRPWGSWVGEAVSAHAPNAGREASAITRSEKAFMGTPLTSSAARLWVTARIGK